MPKSILEASVAGLPVVTTKVPGCREAIINNKTGLHTKVKDYFDLAKKIEKLILDPNLRRKLGNNGKKIAFKKYSDIEVVRKILKIYAK